MNKPLTAVALLILSAAVCAQTTTPTQSPTPDSPITTLKVATRIVAISAVVTGKNGQITGGLTKDDFLLKQDGREEPIRYFSQGSDLPLTIALMVDTSASQRTLISDETLASDIFFETMLGRKQDRALLVEVDSHVRQLRGLTNSPDALHLALLSLGPDPTVPGGTLLQDAIYAVAKNILSKETGRKAMVILTDGGDNGSHKSLAEAIEQAQRADVQIYSILYSAGGLYAPSPGGPAVLFPGGSDSGLKLLQHLSETTGGRVFTVSRTLGLRQIYAEIAEDLRLQYLLGYTPPADMAPNSYHKLDLRAKDKKLAVQARHGFFAQP